MPESPIVGAKVPLDWQRQIQEIAQASGRTEAQILLEALTQYLGKTELQAVRGVGSVLDLCKG